jgi:hypothetical protein
MPRTSPPPGFATLNRSRRDRLARPLPPDPPNDPANSTPNQATTHLGPIDSPSIGAGAISPLHVPQALTIGRAVTLTIPLADPPDSQVHRISAWHVDCQFRDAPSRTAFRQVQEGLLKTGVRLADGRPVITGADSIRWLIQQIAAAIAQNSDETR